MNRSSMLQLNVSGQRVTGERIQGLTTIQLNINYYITETQKNSGSEIKEIATIVHIDSG